MLTAIAQVRLVRWGLLVLGAAMVLWVVAWFTAFGLILAPYGITPFRWAFIRTNLTWPALLVTGLALMGAALALFAEASRLAKTEARRQATEVF